MNSVKTIFLLTLLSAANALVAQKVIINGKEANRLLQWSDFTGSADNASSYLAYTAYTTKVKYSDVQFNGYKAIIKGFELRLEFDANKSWVKKGKASDELLKHEQGHFDTGLLYMQEVLKRMDTSNFTRSNFQQEFRKLMNDTHQKYKEMSLQYDRETTHSIKKEEQEKWNLFFKQQVQR